jgi:group I intron endonuclease
MLLLGIITLVMTIPLASLYLSTILIYRFAFLIFLLNGLLCNLSLLIEVLGGLFQILYLISISEAAFQEAPLLAAPMIIYMNAETEKSQILSSNKGKTGIYQWIHKESGKIYIGSATDLSKRLRNYYSPLYLKGMDNYIARALLFHGHEAFSLAILEHINVQGLSKEDTRKVILEREQFYLDLMFKKNVLTYNILMIAGSSLGINHDPEVIAKISNNTREALSDPATRAKMSVPKSEEHRASMSAAKKGALNHNFGKPRDTETKDKISSAKGTRIYQYDTNGTLVNTFTSANLAGKSFNCCHKTKNMQFQANYFKTCGYYL